MAVMVAAAVVEEVTNLHKSLHTLMRLDLQCCLYSISSIHVD
jgi:hypothetical protein